VLLCTEITLGQQVDTDGDGLSDYQETHKYLTNPNKADSDDDGVSDGDWDERREYTYSVRSILRFMYPFDEDALNDDFQDAIVLEQEDYYIEMEVIHYPFSTAEESISANPNWRQDYADMNEYLDPGITTNWDANMRLDLLAELEADGIVVGNLTDKQVVEQVSYWVIHEYSVIDAFTTFYIHYPNGQPEIYPGLEYVFERDSGPYGWTVEKQFEHELLGKGMFYNKTRGSCTSTAIALTTALRAVGIPARMILIVPIVDPSNESQFQLVDEQISNKQVRQIIFDGLEDYRRPTAFVSHTFCEVYVGNCWHRLNYSKLGQGILDVHLFGLTTHLYTFDDLSNANLAPTWGWRYGKQITDDVFKYGNPYTAIMLSDVFRPVAPILYVDDDAPGDPGPGDPTISDPCEDGSILHPYDSIQQAIDVAEDGNTIIVQEGTYTGLGNRDVDFRGLAITVRSKDPNDPSIVAATIIDCQGSEFEPHRGVCFRSNESTDSILDGLTITGGYISGNWPEDSGGGIICYYNTSPTIKNCIVTNNTAEHHGGGIYSYHSSPTLINCMFNANSAGWNGGGMHNGPSSPNLINCIFSENTSGSYGGGMSTTSTSSPTLTNCTFSGNSGWNGGAIGVYNSNTLLTNCILWGNIPSEIYVAAGDMPNITYSNVQGGYPGTGNINSGPCFVGPDNSDYHLLCSSPCFNTGDPGFTTDSNNVDIDGEPRMRYGRVDMGADELFQIAPDFEPDGDVDFADLAVFTGQWLLEELSWDVYPQGGDGFVDFSDLAVFANSWQNTTDINDLIDFTEQWLLSGAYSYCADIFPESTGDGIVNFLDFVFFANYWLLE